MERLQKVMAEAGVASRRASEKLIAGGHVQVNGKTVTEMGIKVTEHDEVVVDGVPLQREAHVYYLLNKPRSIITSAHDDKGRRTVVDILRMVESKNGYTQLADLTMILLEYCEMLPALP